MKSLKVLFLFICCQLWGFNSSAQYYEDYELLPFEQNGKFGYVLPYWDLVVIPCQFDEAALFHEGLARVKKKGKYGFIDKWGILQIDYQYEDAGYFNYEYCNVKKDGFWGYIDYYNNPIIDFKYEMAFNYDIGYLVVMKNGKFGYIDEKDQPVYDFIFDKAYPFVENTGYVMISDTAYVLEQPRLSIYRTDPEGKFFDLGSDILAFYENQKWALYSRANNDYLTAAIFDDIKCFSEGLAAAKKDGKWGFIDTQGKKVIDFQYPDAGLFSSGIVNVKRDDKWGYIDNSNNTRISFQYDYASPFCKDLAWVLDKDLVYAIDRLGSMQVPVRLSEILEFSEGVAAVNIDNKFGFINASGEITIPPRFDFAADFHSGRSRIRTHSGYGYIDRSGNMIIRDENYQAMDFYDGAAIVWGSHKFGYEIMDTMGNIVNDHQFIEIRPFYNGLAAASNEQSPEIRNIYDFPVDPPGYGYINTAGKVEIDFQFEWAGNFDHGYARVNKGNEYFFIDRSGTQVSQRFYDVYMDGDVMIGVRMNENTNEKEFAIIGHDGAVLSDWFSYISGFENGIGVVADEDRGINFKSLINASGTIISDFCNDISKFNWKLFLAVRKDSSYQSFLCFLDHTGRQTCEWFSELEPVYGGYHIVTKYSDNYISYRTMADPVTGALGKEWYHGIYEFENGIGIAENLTATPYGDAGYTCIDLNGNRLCGFYEGVNNLGEGFFTIESDDQYGLVTRSGLFPVWFADYEEPAEGIIMIYAKKRYWIIDNSGRLLTRDKHIREVMPFHEGRAAVADKKGLYGFIDTDGEQIVPFIYKEANNFSEGLAVVQNKEGKYGYIDKKGTVAIDFLYEYAYDFENGAAYVTLDLENFYIDHQGKRIGQ